MGWHRDRSAAFLALAFSACAGDSSPDHRETGLHPQLGRVVVNKDTTPICGTCSIDMRLIASHGSERDSVLLQLLPQLVVMSGGKLIAFVPGRARQEIVTYEPGQLGSVLGRIGEGPGEYLQVSGVAAFRDSILVTHDGVRVSVFSERGTFVRSFSAPVGFEGPAIVDSSRRLIAVGERGMTSRARSRSGPVHALDAQGEAMSSMGPAPVMSTGRSEWVIANGDSGTIWLSEKQANYRIHQIALSGKTLRTIIRSTPEGWYVFAFLTRAALDSMVAIKGSKDVSKELASRPDYSPIPPRARISGLYQDPGTLWVSLTVGAPGWGKVKLEYPERGSRPREESSSRLYQTIIEAIDIESGALRARTSVNGIGMLLNDGSFARTLYDDSGIVRMERFRLELVQNNTRR